MMEIPPGYRMNKRDSCYLRVSLVDFETNKEKTDCWTKLKNSKTNSFWLCTLFHFTRKEKENFIVLLTERFGKESKDGR
jgi:hypothetical protein